MLKFQAGSNESRQYDCQGDGIGNRLSLCLGMTMAYLGNLVYVPV